MRFFRRNFCEIVLILLLLIGFLYRIQGLERNYSFWVDEAATARFARGIIETGIPKISLTGHQEESYFVTHYLTYSNCLVKASSWLCNFRIIFSSIALLSLFIFKN